MKLALNFLMAIQSFSGALASELQQLVQRCNSWAGVEHNADGTHGDVSVESLTFGGETQTTVGAAGGASALPATPTGYFVVTIAGTEVVVPYYTKA
jgi:hypothetical protein